MTCNNCPLSSQWNTENDKGAECGLFGDGWDSRFQYKDKRGNVIGCYVERCYINKIAAEIDESYRKMAAWFAGEGSRK